MTSETVLAGRVLEQLLRKGVVTVDDVAASVGVDGDDFTVELDGDTVTVSTEAAA
jgi:hypothetical protein